MFKPIFFCLLGMGCYVAMLLAIRGGLGALMVCVFVWPPLKRRKFADSVLDFGRGIFLLEKKVVILTEFYALKR